MKKLFKKIATIVMVAVIAVSAMVIPTTTASAANIFDGAIKISELEYYSTNFSAAKEYQYYKIVLPSNGDITLRCNKASSPIYQPCQWYFYNSNAEEIKHGSFSDNSNEKVENLKAGTYYLYVLACTDIAHATDFYYTFTPDLKPTISLKVTITKGTTLQLGSVVENYDGKVTWESTKKSVATVTSKGKVTAKKKGTTTIRAKLSDGTYVQIRVVVKNPATKNTTTTTK